MGTPRSGMNFGPLGPDDATRIQLRNEALKLGRADLAEARRRLFSMGYPSWFGLSPRATMIACAFFGVMLTAIGTGQLAIGPANRCKLEIAELNQAARQYQDQGMSGVDLKAAVLGSDAFKRYGACTKDKAYDRPVS